MLTNDTLRLQDFCRNICNMSSRTSTTGNKSLMAWHGIACLNTTGCDRLTRPFIRLCSFRNRLSEIEKRVNELSPLYPAEVQVMREELELHKEALGKTSLQIAHPHRHVIARLLPPQRPRYKAHCAACVSLRVAERSIKKCAAARKCVAVARFKTTNDVLLCLNSTGVEMFSTQSTGLYRSNSSFRHLSMGRPFWNRHKARRKSEAEKRLVCDKFIYLRYVNRAAWPSLRKRVRVKTS